MIGHPGGQDGAILPDRDTSFVARKYTDHVSVLFFHIINPLFTKLARLRWLDIGLVLGQYSAILPSHLVNNPCMFSDSGTYMEQW